VTARIGGLIAGAAFYVGGGGLVWMLVGMITGWTAAHGLVFGLEWGLASAALGAAGCAAFMRWRRRRTSAPES